MDREKLKKYIESVEKSIYCLCQLKESVNDNEIILNISNTVIKTKIFKEELEKYLDLKTLDKL